MTVVSLVSNEGQMAASVVPLVSCGRCVVLSVVSPVSCAGGRAGDGGDVSFKRGLMVAVVVLLLVISFVRVKPVAPMLVCSVGVVKPVAPLLAENGCFSGETV